MAFTIEHQIDGAKFTVVGEAGMRIVEPGSARHTRSLCEDFQRMLDPRLVDKLKPARGWRRSTIG
jgi:hypothetical protein